MNRVQKLELNIVLLIIGFVIANIIFVNLLSNIKTPEAMGSSEELSMVEVCADDWNIISDHEVDYTLPDDMNRGIVMRMSTAWVNFDLYVGDTCILQYRDNPDETQLKEIFVTIPDESGGKILNFRNIASSEEVAKLVKNTAHIGSSLLVYRQFWRSNYYIIIHVFVSAFILVILAFVLIAMRKTLSPKMKRSMLYLCLFVWNMEVGIITESNVVALWIINGKLGLYSNYFFLMSTPFAALLLLNSLSVKPSAKIELFAVISEIFPILVLISWEKFNFRAISNFWISFLVLTVYVIIILLFVGREVLINKNGDLKIPCFGFAAFAVAALISGIMYINDPGGPYVSVLAIGSLVVYMLFSLPLIATVVNIVQENVQVNAYREMAYQDILTGLSNRNALKKDMLDYSDSEEEREVCVVSMDLNNLKFVNDNFGHAEGDQLIQNAAKCISDNFEMLGKCYRIGGDEFAVIAYDVNKTAIEDAIQAMQKEEETLNDTQSARLQIAYGVAWNDEGISNLEKMINLADARMYACKKEMKRLDAAKSKNGTEIENAV